MRAARRRGARGAARRAFAPGFAALAGVALAGTVAAQERVDGAGMEALPILSVEPPARPFGRVLGDVLTRRVRLADANGPIALAELPAEGRIDVWFDRWPSRLSVAADGTSWLELREQLVNSPVMSRVTALPGATLLAEDGRRFAIPPVPVAIGPLVAPAAAPSDALPAMRPDRLLPPVDTAAVEARAGRAALALGATLSAWIGWWLVRRRRDAVRLPFSRALVALRALGREGRAATGERGEGGRYAAVEDHPDAWGAVHAALNATAGRVSGAGDLDALIGRVPWLESFRERLHDFHAASAARFFEQPPRAAPFALGALARDLERAERRHAR